MEYLADQRRRIVQLLDLRNILGLDCLEALLCCLEYWQRLCQVGVTLLLDGLRFLRDFIGIILLDSDLRSAWLNHLDALLFDHAEKLLLLDTHLL